MALMIGVMIAVGARVIDDGAQLNDTILVPVAVAAG
jgi:hypothetical protein